MSRVPDSLAISFINFSKEFDSFHWPSLLRVLLSYEIPEKIIKAIECISDNSCCCVRTEDGFSIWLQVVTGVWQGCILSPILFAVAVDWVLKTMMIDQGIAMYEGSTLSNPDFVDDITALLDSTQGLQWIVSDIGKVTGGLGLSISKKNTKIMLSGNHQPFNDVLIV